MRCQERRSSTDWVAAANCRRHNVTAIAQVMAVNSRSYFLFSKFVIGKAFLPQGGGVIVNMASVQGLQSVPCVPAYASSKGAVINFTRNLAVEYATKNIRVNAVNPGSIRTPMLMHFLDDDAMKVDPTPMKRWGQPEEIAAAVYVKCHRHAVPRPLFAWDQCLCLGETVLTNSCVAGGHDAFAQLLPGVEPELLYDRRERVCRRWVDGVRHLGVKRPVQGRGIEMTSRCVEVLMACAP